jgi:hypothetical protein
MSVAGRLAMARRVCGVCVVVLCRISQDARVAASKFSGTIDLHQGASGAVGFRGGPANAI